MELVAVFLGLSWRFWRSFDLIYAEFYSKINKINNHLPHSAGDETMSNVRAVHSF